MFDPQHRAVSLMGRLQAILVPEALGFADPTDLGRAMAAWRYDLSREDIGLLEHLARGMTNAEIAERMGLVEENSIKNRLKTVYSKLGARNRAQAALIAAWYGFAEQPASPPHPNE